MVSTSTYVTPPSDDSCHRKAERDLLVNVGHEARRERQRSARQPKRRRRERSKPLKRENSIGPTQCRSI